MIDRIAWICIVLITLLGVALTYIIPYLYEYKKARRVGPITQEPFVPYWTQCECIRKEIRGAVTVYRCPFDREYQDRFNRIECTKEAYDTVHKLILEKTGVDIPEDACIVQVPMSGFKCGPRCTDFERDEPTGPFSYQMFGGSRIQIVSFTEDGIAKVAGFTIYIPYPYDPKIYYNMSVINRCYQQLPIENPVYDGDVEMTEFLLDRAVY